MSNPELKFYFKIDKKETLTVEKKTTYNKTSRKNKVKLSKEEYEETIIKWDLFEFLHTKDEHFGMPWSSSKSLNNGLSANSILKYLNSNLVFDFYTPKENDNLMIRMEYKHPETNRKSRPFIGDFISLIFKREWEINKGFEHIDNSYKEIEQGELIIVQDTST